MKKRIKNKKKIVFLEVFLNPATYNIANALKKDGEYETILISLASIEKHMKEKFINKAFDKAIIYDLELKYTLKNLFKIYKIVQKINKTEFNEDVLQIRCTSFLSFFVLFFLKKKSKILFIYDIWQYHLTKFKIKELFQKDSGKFQRINSFFEKRSIKISDAIVNKSGENSLSDLNYKIKIPIMDFLPYCVDDWIIPPKKKKNKEINIVYAGTTWNRWKNHASFFEMIKKIVDQKIHLHVYPTRMKPATRASLERIKSEYLHIYPKQDADKIGKEISKYDFGIHLDFMNDKIDPRWSKNGMSNKIFGYIEAGLPVIINKQFVNMTNIIEGNNVGFGIDYQELFKLKEIIENYAYPNVKTIKKAQENLKISKHIDRLVKFYNKLSKAKQGL